MAEPSKMQQALAEKRARDAAKQAPSPVAEPESPYADFGLEDVDEAGYKKTQDDQAIDQIIGGLTVMGAYQKFVPKDPKTKRSGADEYLVSCPNPLHPDKVPSACVNIKTELWTCYSCGKGGDAIDLVALQMGYTDASYKSGKNFVELRKKIAVGMGWTPQLKAAGQTQQMYSPPVTPAGPPPPPSAATLTLDPRVTLAPQVTSIKAAPSYNEPVVPDDGLDEDKDFDYPTIDWRAIVPEDTFLWRYMEATCELQVAEEYNFWNGMVAIGAALGHKVSLRGQPINVYGNLYVCTVGPSGGGKTQASHPLEKMLREVMPWHPDDQFTQGIKFLSTPASGEFMIQQFTHSVADPTDPKTEIIVPVKGLVNFSEMSEMVTKMQRSGSTLKDACIDMYDNKPRVSSGSITSSDKSATNPYCMMTSTTQLKSIKGLLTERDAASGFLGRWVFSMGPQKERDLWGDSLGDMVPATMLLQQIFAWASNVPLGVQERVLRIEKSAVAESVRAWQAKGLPIKTGDTSELFVRLDLLYKKLILLFAANSKEDVVSIQSVNSATALFDYIIASYKAIGARIGSTEITQMEGRVYKALKNFEANHAKAPAPMNYPTGTDLVKVLKNYHISAKDLKQIIDNLGALGMIESVPLPPLAGAGKQGARYRHVV